jgi:hypothetical protein
MFETAAAIGGLDVQLVYFRGIDECRSSAWFSDANPLVKQMTMIKCMAGETQIARVLEHIRKENAREKVSAAIFIGDSCEEEPGKLYDAAAGLGVPVFCFHERADTEDRFRYGPSAREVETIFRKIAQLTGGAYAPFDSGAAARLAELLAAVAAFATGGLKALGDLRTDSARKLLGQMK